MRVLIVDDDRAVRDALRRALMLAGYDIAVAVDGPEALDKVAETVPDAVLLDVGLPGMDGLEVCRTLRREGNRVPVLILTARGAVGDRILGLNTGADDYLPKPFDLDELEARIRALARRVLPDAAPPEFCGMRVDAGSGAIYFRGEVLDLAPREAALLRALLARPGGAVAKERLTELVFPGEDQVQAEAIEVVAYRLRKRLAETGAQLVTLRGLGYLLKAGA